MRKRWTALGAILLALLGAGAALAIGSSRRRSPGRSMTGARAGRIAKADAARQLAAVRFPPGARQVRRDPSVRPLGSAWHSSGPQSRGCRILAKYDAWDTAFWRVPGTPDSVWNWMQNHPPVPAFDSGRWYDENPGWKGPAPWGIDFIFKMLPHIVSRTDYVTLWFAKGGGTAVRVDTRGNAETAPQPQVRSRSVLLAIRCQCWVLPASCIGLQPGARPSPGGAFPYSINWECAKELVLIG
jgi:hypothetical protein